MLEKFQKITPESITENPFSLIGKKWYLLSAGTAENHTSMNTMTASWGAVGVLWGAPSLHCFVRTNRHTLSYLDQNEFFTASFFEESYRDALSFCGTNSGRDVDKIAHTGLTPMDVDDSVAFEEASLILVCRKRYTAMLQETGFVTPETFDTFYAKEPLHREFIGEIIACYQKI